MRQSHLSIQSEAYELEEDVLTVITALDGSELKGSTQPGLMRDLGEGFRRGRTISWLGPSSAWLQGFRDLRVKHE